MIESFIPGRVRLRSPLLSQEDTARLILRTFQAIPQARSVTMNEKTGSLLFEYDPQALPMERLKELLPLLSELQNLEKEPPSPRRRESLKALLVKALEKML
jgi:hypothetical protein